MADVPQSTSEILQATRDGAVTARASLLWLREDLERTSGSAASPLAGGDRSTGAALLTAAADALGDLLDRLDRDKPAQVSEEETHGK